ncbi:MAG: squalene--hopene cyclase [Planctomycetes bacterium]|nr:squalene--hopene cyclase [Planctomycetota bacterium]
MIDPAQLRTAYETARRDLLAERSPAGHWVGELSSSALSTATAVSALAVAIDHCDTDDAETDIHRRLIARGLEWLAQGQNDDGGWGDTDKSLSNIATTMLVRAAFHLAGAAENHRSLLDSARAYLDRQGGVAGLRARYGRDKTFAVPILTNSALAGLTPWRDVAALPFELACVPHRIYRFLRLPVVSYAIPALVAIGQARYFHQKPLNPLTWALRHLAVPRSLDILERMQPASGGFLEATPLTSFVAMSLAGSGQAAHPVVRRGLKFLAASIRDDGSWPIDTNLATWVTTLSINALAASGEDVAQLGCLDWLLACQHRDVHPLTSAASGGWGWSDLSGAVPDADDTPGALLALAALRRTASGAEIGAIDAAAADGIHWLLALQNRDGGWPTFCRGWGKLPFDRSGVDLTAHAIRALHAWRRPTETPDSGSSFPFRSIDRAIRRGFRYLARRQRPDGGWLPLWFGNQHRPDEENPVYGTARVLLAYRDLGRLLDPPARRGLEWLSAAQNADGGWGSGGARPSGGGACEVSSVEETAVAVEALISPENPPHTQPATEGGVAWLVAAVESGRHRESSPIGFYFARLWYYEKLYPLVFSVSALGRAMCLLGSKPNT